MPTLIEQSLLNALGADARVTVCVSSQGVGRARRLFDSIPEIREHGRFQWFASNIKLPSILVIDRRLVAITTGSWLDEKGRNEFGVLVKSTRLAEDLLRLIQDGTSSTQ